MGVEKINTPQKHLELFKTDLMSLPTVFRPGEPIFFQPFLPETEPISIPIECFEFFTVSTAKEKKIIRERVEFELPFYNPDQSIDLLSKVCFTRFKEYANGFPLY